MRGTAKQQPDRQKASSRAAVILGILLVLAGLVTNRWTVGHFTTVDGPLRWMEMHHLGFHISRGLIVALSAVLVLVGAGVLWGQVNIRRSLLAGGVVALLVVTIVLGLYGSSKARPAPPWAAEGLTMAERLTVLAGHTSANWLNAQTYRGLFDTVPLASRSLHLQKRLGMALLMEGKAAEAVEVLEGLRDVAGARAGPFAPSAKFMASVRAWLVGAYLRLAEQDNCTYRGVGSTRVCYLPLREGGSDDHHHYHDRGARGAIKEATAGLEARPNDLGARWILNLAYSSLGEYPEKVPAKWLIPPDAFKSEYPIKRFREVAGGLGLAARGNAGGSIMEDFDGDGDLDLMASSQGLHDSLRYFQNNGDGTFTERTKEAGLSGQVGGLNIIHADYNNDGYPDVLVQRGAWFGKIVGEGRHPSSLLRNNGDGTFTDVTEAAGILAFAPTQAAAWGDYDNDGWIDLFIGYESQDGERYPSRLYRNNRDGTFSDLAAAAGITVGGFIKGAAWGDYDNDGRLDLYVTRWGQPNVLYRNDGRKGGRWSFTDVTAQAGVSGAGWSFPTWLWDYDNDGWLDIFVGGFKWQKSTLADIAALYLGLPFTPVGRSILYRNNGDGTFTDVTAAVKLDRLLLVMAANFGDLDNDGYPDLYLGTGAPHFTALLPKRMFRSAAGKEFQDVTTAGGFGIVEKGHGVSFGDIDNDGDQDIYSVIGGWYTGDVSPIVLFENPGHGNHWITLRLEGVQSNRPAIGARIKVRVDTGAGQRDIHATVSTGGSFGTSSLQQEIGLGRAVSIRAIEITWPATGRTQVFRNVAMDRILRIREGDAAPVPVNAKAFTLRPSPRQNLPIDWEVLRKH